MRIPILAFLIAFMIAACARGPAPYAPNTPMPQVAFEAADYRLGPGDGMRVIVYGEPDLSGDFVVSQQGSVAFPLVGEIPASGLTIADLAKALEAKLATGFVREPHVSVEVTTYRPFYILGEVTRPGTYPFAAKLTVMDAVATAGGFTYRADSRKVMIKHAGYLYEQTYPLTSATPVQPGDTIRIPERLF